MPMFRPTKAPKPIEIEKFYGLNQSIGETEIKLGESVKHLNFRLTQDYKPQKREGHNTFVDFGNDKAVQGLWQGFITKEVMIMINDGKVYEYDLSKNAVTEYWSDLLVWDDFETWFDSYVSEDIADLISNGVVTQLGTITDAPTSIFWFNNALYFINGTDYKTYNGTTYGDVVGYIPTIAIGTPPLGGGTDFEQVNLLTGFKKQKFVGNATTLFQLRETAISSDLVTATVNGVAKTETTDFTVNRTLGQVTFTVAPIAESEVVIKWNKTSSTNVALVKNNRFAMDFGPGNDVVIFLWGNQNIGHRRMRSATLDASYFPEFNFTLIGSSQFPITDIIAQYDRQIVYTTARTFYSYAEYVSTTSTYEYPVYDLNEAIGNTLYNGIRLVDNSPISIYGQSLWKWSNTSVEDERNAQVISERIRYSIENLNLSSAVTYDYQKEKEYWLNIGEEVYIWNYGNDTFYMYDNIKATKFIDYDNVVYYGGYGTIEKFGELNDNGEPIYAIIELGFTDFGVNELKKSTRNIWCAIQPYSRTSLTMSYATQKFNTGESKDIKPIEYILMDYASIDYSAWSYATNRNPQVFMRKLRATKYSYIKMIFENSEPDEQLVILSIKLVAESQGFNK